MQISPRTAGAVALLALLPVALYVATDEIIAAVALVNVFLISYSLYRLLAPTEEGHDHDHGDGHGA